MRRTTGAKSSTPVAANGTDVFVSFSGGADFSAHVGKMVSLELELKGASVYTIGWSAGAAAAAAEE